MAKIRIRLRNHERAGNPGAVEDHEPSDFRNGHLHYFGLQTLTFTAKAKPSRLVPELRQAARLGEDINGWAAKPLGTWNG